MSCNVSLCRLVVVMLTMPSRCLTGSRAEAKRLHRSRAARSRQTDPSRTRRATASCRTDWTPCQTGALSPIAVWPLISGPSWLCPEDVIFFNCSSLAHCRCFYGFRRTTIAAQSVQATGSLRNSDRTAETFCKMNCHQWNWSFSHHQTPCNFGTFRFGPFSVKEINGLLTKIEFSSFMRDLTWGKNCSVPS